MNYRIASLLSSESATTAATKTIDLNVRKPISRITVQMKATNNGSVPTAHPAKMISKIELVDGSNVLASLTGIQAQALNFYETGRLPLTFLDYRNDVMAIVTFELNFGRWLWDEVLALDATKFNNPQLKISHNLALGGSAPDAATLSVFAHAFDQKEAKPTGFLMSKEQYSYTLVASAKEKIDLATDLPYRKILVQSLSAGKQPWENFNKIKLSEDNDAVVIINDESTSDLLKLFSDDPRIIERIVTHGTGAAQTIYCTPTYDQNCVGMGMDQADTSIFATQGYGGTESVLGENTVADQYHVSGRNPHGAMEIPFGRQDEPADWYNVSKVGSLAMTITGGSGASGTVQIVSQQVRNY